MKRDVLSTNYWWRGLAYNVINWESYQPTIDEEGLLILVLIVGKLGEGMRSCKYTGHDLYACGCQWQWPVCQWRNGKCVYVSVCVCVCVCHCSCSLSSWVQGTCLAHITSIKVLSRSLPRKSLFFPTVPFTRFVCLGDITEVSRPVFLRLVLKKKKGVSLIFFP